MLSYQHSYHAGCFADVMKHVLLTRLLQYLIQKDAPLLYVDTHSGRGQYDLQDSHALKTNEAQIGIQPVWERREKLSPLFSPYIHAITQLNIENTLRYYPGSPELALQMLRKQDRLVFCELHPTEFNFLQQLTTQRRVFFKKEDGLHNIKALLPPVERRGLVFVDPSYERKTEYQEVIEALKAGFKRCPTMTYCLWYPLIGNKLPPNFLQNLRTIDSKNVLRLEFYINQKSGLGMTGSGLWIINPPYTLAEEGNKILHELKTIIQPDSATYRVD